jgi:hypothetical protein
MFSREVTPPMLHVFVSVMATVFVKMKQEKEENV